MNLVEELAKHIFALDCGDSDEMMWEAIANKPLRRKEAIPFILLFAEFIKGIENPFTDLSDHNGRVCNMAAETLRTLILDELEKMKNDPR